MSKLMEMVEQFMKERERSDIPLKETPQIDATAEISAAKERVLESHALRSEWARVCAELARSQDWQSLEYKAGHSVAGGEYGWRIFCNEANLTTLRDQVSPLLVQRVDTKRPAEDECKDVI